MLSLKTSVIPSEKWGAQCHSLCHLECPIKGQSVFLHLGLILGHRSRERQSLWLNRFPPATEQPKVGSGHDDQVLGVLWEGLEGQDSGRVSRVKSCWTRLWAKAPSSPL